MLFRFSITAVIGYSLILPLAVWAEESVPAPLPTRSDVEVIEVIGDNNYQSLNYQVLHRDDFVNSSQTLSDLLKSINGIQIRQISGIGNPASVSIRGSTSKQVQLYIDGQLVNDSQFGGFDLNQIPTEQIQSIEVSKNQALGTGATPIGGVIRINTYNPKENTLRVSAGVGCFGFGELNLINNHVFEHNNLSFGASRLQSDNDFEFLVPQDFDNPQESAVQGLRNNDFEKNTMFINNEAQFGEHQIRLNMQYSDQQKAIANYQNNSPNNRTRLESETVRYGYQHNWQSGIDWMEQLEFEFYRQDKSEQFFGETGGPLNRYSDYDSDKQSFTIKPYLTLQTLKITPFIEYNRQQFNSETTQNGEPNQCNGIGACDVAAEQKQLTYGSRFDWQPEPLGVSSYLLFSKLDEKNSNAPVDRPFVSVLKTDKNYGTRELGFNYKDNVFNAQISYSDGVRTPTMFELFGDRGLFKGNDDLLPEEAKTVSFGVGVKTSDYSVSTSVYHRLLDNSIVAIFSSAGIGRYSNVSSAELMGLELQGQYQFTPDLSLVLQANVISSNTDSQFVSFDDKKLPGIYHQQYSAAVQYQINPSWSVNVKTSVDRELYFNRANLFQSSNNIGNGNPANRVLSDIYLNWKHSSFNASLSFNNIFDEDYQDLANRPAQGSSIQFKISIEDL
jgi:vitamin B12 transporter